METMDVNELKCWPRKEVKELGVKKERKFHRQEQSVIRFKLMFLLALKLSNN